MLLERCCKKNKDLTLKDLAKYDASKISQFLSQQSVYTLEDGSHIQPPTTEQINKLIDAL